MLLVIAVATPAMTMDAHAAAHRTSSVDATHHHHHDADGAVIAADQHDHDREAPADEDDGGHEHMPIGQILFETAPPPAQFGDLIAVSATERSIGSDRALPNIVPAPPNRPPRSN